MKIQNISNYWFIFILATTTLVFFMGNTFTVFVAIAVGLFLFLTKAFFGKKRISNFLLVISIIYAVLVSMMLYGNYLNSKERTPNSFEPLSIEKEVKNLNDQVPLELDNGVSLIKVFLEENVLSYNYEVPALPSDKKAFANEIKSIFINKVCVGDSLNSRALLSGVSINVKYFEDGTSVYIEFSVIPGDCMKSTQLEDQV